MNAEIEKHEILKQTCVYSYDVNKHKIPTGYNLIKTYSARNGFYSCVLKKNNDIIIVYRGTNDWKDIQSDANMFFRHNFPVQAYNALSLYMYTENIYRNCNITVTGHSLGGSLAQIVGAITGVKAVTFNAYGTGNFFENKNNIHTNNIVNYCNPKDPIVQSNILNQLGKCYEINSNDSSNYYHFIEKMQPLKNRILSTPEELQGAWHNMKRIKEEWDYYRRTGKHLPMIMSGMSENKCNGSYPVSGYTRHDGTEVDGYIRKCYVHGK